MTSPPRYEPARPFSCLLATSTDVQSTATLPRLLAAAGGRVTTLSPILLSLSLKAKEKIRTPRDPSACAMQLRALLKQRRFDWVIVADETLLRALLERGDPEDLASWFPFDPCDEALTALLLSKHAFASQARARGIPIPPSHLANNLAHCVAAAEEFGYPVVIKGDRGFGGSVVHVTHDENALRRCCAELLAEDGRVLVQRFVGGSLIAVDVIYLKGEPLGFQALVGDKYYPDDRSLPTVRRCFRHSALSSIVASVGKVTGFSGLCGIDVLHDQSTGSIYVLEVNPRPVPGFSATAANLDFFTPLVARFIRGEPGPAVHYNEKKLHVYFPENIFYFLTRADKRHALEYSNLLRSCGEFRLDDSLIAGYQIARFIYMQLGWASARRVLRRLFLPKNRP